MDVYQGRVNRDGDILPEGSEAEPPEDVRDEPPNTLCVLLKSVAGLFSPEAARSNRRRCVCVCCARVSCGVLCVRQRVYVCLPLSTLVAEIALDGKHTFTTDPVPVTDQNLQWNYAVTFGVE